MPSVWVSDVRITTVDKTYFLLSFSHMAIDGYLTAAQIILKCVHSNVAGL